MPSPLIPSVDERAVLRLLETAWAEPVQTITFRVKTFRIDYPGMTTFGVLSFWGKVRHIARFIVRIPLWLIGLVVLIFLETSDFGSKPTSGPGTVHLEGTTRTEAATRLVEALSAARQPVIVAFSPGHLAFFASAQSGHQLLWESAPDARVRYGPVWPNKLGVDWVEGTQCWLSTTDEQHELVVRFFAEHGA